jgi:hypothetical protein
MGLMGLLGYSDDYYLISLRDRSRGWVGLSEIAIAFLERQSGSVAAQDGRIMTQ